MRLPDFEADCDRCAALCCVALAFDRSEFFGADKPAGEPCTHLRDDNGCAIHGQRGARGYGGCIAFACNGAGQRVVQEVFSGRDWRASAGLAQRMFDAFRAMRQVHDLLSLLETAGTLPLPFEQEMLRAALVAELCPEAGWTEEGLMGFEVGGLPRRVRGFLEGLRDHVDGVRAGE